MKGIPSKRPIIEMTIPSRFFIIFFFLIDVISLDPTLAPPGKHVASLFVQYVPRKFNNGETWDSPNIKKKFIDSVFSIVEEFAPGFFKRLLKFNKILLGFINSVLYVDILTPLDLERIFNLTGKIFLKKK